MPIDPTVLAEARALVAKAGMVGFVPASAAPTSTEGQPVAIALIDPPTRKPGVPNFDKADPERPGVIRSASILAKVRDGVPLDPVLLFQRAGAQRYELLAGFHRLHLCAALGFTHVPAEVRDESWM